MQGATGNWASYIKDFYAAIDTMETQNFSAFFDPSQGSFTMANNPVMVGHAAIEEGAKSVFAVLKSIAHDITYVGYSGDKLFCEGLVKYHRKDDKQFVMGFAATFVFSENRSTIGSKYPAIKTYTAYVDNTALFA